MRRSYLNVFTCSIETQNFDQIIQQAQESNATEVTELAEPAAKYELIKSEGKWWYRHQLVVVGMMTLNEG